LDPGFVPPRLSVLRVSDGRILARMIVGASYWFSAARGTGFHFSFTLGSGEFLVGIFFFFLLVPARREDEMRFPPRDLGLGVIVPTFSFPFSPFLPGGLCLGCFL